MDFMQQVCYCLEPRMDPARTTIINELDEFGDITFITKGNVALGFEINKMIKYAIVFRNKCVIGAFGVTFNQRANYVYTTLTETHGLFIRKENWMEIMDSNPQISNAMKKNILVEYYINIRSKIRQKKLIDLENYDQRQDYQVLVTSQEKENSQLKNIVRMFLLSFDSNSQVTSLNTEEVENEISKVEQL